MPANEALDGLATANLSINGIRNTETALGRCSVERQDTLDCHPATVTKTKIDRKRARKETK